MSGLALYPPGAPRIERDGVPRGSQFVGVRSNPRKQAHEAGEPSGTGEAEEESE